MATDKKHELKPVPGEPGAFCEAKGEDPHAYLWLSRDAARRRFEKQTGLSLPDIIEERNLPERHLDAEGNPKHGDNFEDPYLYVPAEVPFFYKTKDHWPDLWGLLAAEIANALQDWYYFHVFGSKFQINPRHSLDDLDAIHERIDAARKQWVSLVREWVFLSGRGTLDRAFSNLESVYAIQREEIQKMKHHLPNRTADDFTRRFYLECRDAGKGTASGFGSTRIALLSIFYMVLSQDSRSADQVQNEGDLQVYCVTRISESIKKSLQR